MPSVSKMQWHPFTVNSNSNMEADKLSVVIKSLGSWSQKLYQQLSSNSMDHIQVSVEGPYGPTSSHFLRSVLKRRSITSPYNFGILSLKYCCIGQISNLILADSFFGLVCINRFNLGYLVSNSKEITS